MENARKRLRRGDSVYNIETGELLIVDEDDLENRFGYMQAFIPIEDAKAQLYSTGHGNLTLVALGTIPAPGSGAPNRMCGIDAADTDELLERIGKETGWGDDSRERVMAAAMPDNTNRLDE